ncbi:hypothetical protein GLAREA_11335 [Glarea lozoyensis ATCC 20868]|uniref:Uncharacterized protein n=1 Tax=Glarea lozoyensis (strain ATCC 20868 / MF5171) TaxID=1116229 RepID=S3DD24_GLAL2|nr:uncharacterized protein GLAREA_11335 [Glarea lozoyensis ATCC 20868]EPE35635.1 hypothetical protein GLAREA_11335 [Glarea lozoyensis ATCC 20868]
MAGYMLFRIWEYVASLNSPATETDPERLKLQASFGPCTIGYPLHPPPDVRFDMSDKSIYGFISQNESAPWVLHIHQSSPAIRSYILGSNWESQLVKIPGNKNRNHTHDCIPIPDDPIDESNHCLLMKRAGAKLRNPTPPWEKEPCKDPYYLFSRRQIMGWPESGGVWVYKIRKHPLTDDTSIDDEIDYFYRVAEGEETDPELEEDELRTKLFQETTMEGHCEVLKQYGATFYENPADCPEVKLLGLQGTISSSQ